MIVYITMSTAHIILIAFLTRENLLSRIRQWILPAFMYTTVIYFANTFQFSGKINTILAFSISLPFELLFYMSLFKFNLLKAYLLKLLLYIFIILPEIVFPLIIVLLKLGNQVTGRIDLRLSFFTFLTSMILLILFRKKAKDLLRWFDKLSEESQLSLVVLSVNMDWFFITLNSTALDRANFGNDTILLYSIVGGFILINAIPAYVLYKSARKLSHQSKSYNIQVAKEMLSDYLSQIHDLKNIAQVLDIDVDTNTGRSIGVVEKMIDLKKHKANKKGISFLQPYLSNVDFALNLDEEHPFFHSLNYSVIVGILLDNAIEHIASDNHLEKLVQLDWYPDQNCFSVSNAITPSGYKFLSEPAIGRTTKEDILLSGFGLSNAKLLAAEHGSEIVTHLREASVTFSVVGVAAT